MPFRSPVVMLFALLTGAVVALATLASSAQAASFMDAAGRRVVLPDVISRILPAERNAEVLVFVLAPQKLAAIEATANLRGAVPSGIRPALLRWQPRSAPDSMAATAQRVGADLIIDAGPVTPDRGAFADAVQRLSGIPYILLDDSFDRMPRVLRSIGAVLGVAERGDDLGTYAEHAVSELRGRLLIRQAHTRPHIYYGLDADGMTTALPGSPAGETLDQAGTINVAGQLGRGTQVRISRDQLLAWDPHVIIAERRSFYDSLRRDRHWRRLSAVRNKKVYLEPTYPFGWIEGPSGVNRLIGMYWLAGLLYPEDAQEELRSSTWRAVACEFYDKFYRIKLTNARLESILQPAGAPPLVTARMPAEAPAGLGGAPSSVLPSGTPGALSAAAPLPSVGGDPSATCSLPTGPSPKPIPGITSLPSTPLDTPSTRAPGVPPPGQRGQPAAGLPR